MVFGKNKEAFHAAKNTGKKGDKYSRIYETDFLAKRESLSNFRPLYFPYSVKPFFYHVSKCRFSQ